MEDAKGRDVPASVLPGMEACDSAASLRNRYLWSSGQEAPRVTSLPHPLQTRGPPHLWFWVTTRAVTEVGSTVPGGRWGHSVQNFILLLE